MPRVAVVDPRPLARTGVRTMLEAAGIDVAASTAPARADDTIRRLQPDVLVIGVTGHDVLERLARWRAPHPVRVVVIVDDRDEALLRAAIDAHCDGVQVDTATSDELVAAVRAVHAGRQVVHHAAMARLVGDRWTAPVQRPLSARELQVLGGAARGLSNAQIADELGVAPSTVKTQMGRALEKLGANDRTQAVAIALRRRLLS